MIGLDTAVVAQLNFELAIKRISKDIVSDFIFAPHINAVYAHAQDELCDEVRRLLTSGHYNPGLPLTIEVLKPSGLSRPGSILMPVDRLIYQVVVDRIAPAAEACIYRDQVMSNVLLSGPDPDGFMFQQSSACYERFQERVTLLASDGANSYVLKADVASYFERLYQHNLVNSLRNAGCCNSSVNLLEEILKAFTQRDSHGIIQGVFPSDFLGNFYLNAIDAWHRLKALPSARYVDDMYVFFPDSISARRHLIELIGQLRTDGLNLNEAKTRVARSSSVILEETELDNLFEAAQEEVRESLNRADFYESNIPWDEAREDNNSEVAEGAIQLAATKQLYDMSDLDKSARRKVDRYCISVFEAAGDDYALRNAIGKYSHNPDMAQLMAKYFRKLALSDQDIRVEIEDLITNATLAFDMQYMWLYASLMDQRQVRPETVNVALQQLTNSNCGDALKAVSAVFSGKFGNAAQKRILRTSYAQVQSPYVRAAILYATRYFTADERRSCLAAWSGHSDLHTLISIAMRNMSHS